MSAFVVSDNHIHALLTYANKNQVYIYHNGKRYSTDDVDELATLADAMEATNVQSVNKRYAHHNDPTPVEKIGFKFFGNISHMQAIKAAHCYDYQACELDNYGTTLAAAVSRAIQAHAMRNMPGYDKAPWCID